MNVWFRAILSCHAIHTRIVMSVCVPVGGYVSGKWKKIQRLYGVINE